MSVVEKKGLVQLIALSWAQPTVKLRNTKKPQQTRLIFYLAYPGIPDVLCM